MKCLDLSFADPAENLACDEALLEWCESPANGDQIEILRFWDCPNWAVILGMGNAAAREANLDACRAARVPLLRRCSGGGAVVQGPGILNYALILAIRPPELTSITGANHFILHRHVQALGPLSPGATLRVEGHTDLTADGRKFSGNSQRRRRFYLLFHGTFLLDPPLKEIEAWLPMPSKQPDYRDDLSHSRFLTRFPAAPAGLKQALRSAWNADEEFTDVPFQRIQELATEKYRRKEWNLKI